VANLPSPLTVAGVARRALRLTKSAMHTNERSAWQVFVIAGRNGLRTKLRTLVSYDEKILPSRQAKMSSTITTMCCENCGNEKKEKARFCSVRCRNEHGSRVQRDRLLAAQSPIKCGVCLYAVGFGGKRIQRITGVNRHSVLGRIRRSAINRPQVVNRSIMAKKRKCKAWVYPDLVEDKKLLREVISDIRSELKNSPKETERIRARARGYYAKNKLRICRLAKANVPYQIAKRLRMRVWELTQGNQKAGKTMTLTGCSVEFLCKHLESTFQPGMTWQNRSLWHIDHIIPCSSFDLSKKEDQMRCFHFSNLRALWASDNIIKNDTLPKQHQSELLLQME